MNVTTPLTPEEFKRRLPAALAIAQAETESPEDRLAKLSSQAV
ncbi:hypothetical protein [Deinococcus multiflagellatus]|uniref:Uncharacterized protein n=1 Tax=Deinococcus multiflagellatus TaxID=1656887 RepID=A0ABW1ZQ53_9DEIO|nr:hypothetical protein [Deinococcus multiflagellatus]